MKEVHVYIYGEIDAWQGESGPDFGVVSLRSVKDQIEKEPDAEKIVAHIHSVGGVVFEGFAIHDYLRSLGKPVETRIEGLCASIATVIALAGDVRVMTENSDFFIHNPWGMAFGDREQVQRYADDLERLENKIAEFYASKTKITVDEALALMKTETTFSAAEALEKGFITEAAPALKAVAKFDPEKEFAENKRVNNEKPVKMSKPKVKDQEKVNGIFARLASVFKAAAEDAPVNKIVQDANGEEIDFPDLEEDATPEVGDRAEIGGNAAEGERVMPGGETYVFTAGELTEIRPAESEEEEEESEEMTALREENERLTQELEAANARASAAEKAQAKAEKKAQTSATALASIQEDVNKLKKELGSEFETEPKNSKKENSGSEDEARPLFKSK